MNASLRRLVRVTLGRVGGLLLFVCSVFAANASRAAVLDWNSLTWTAGNLSMTYYATNDTGASGLYFYDPNFRNGDASSVTVSVSGNTGFFTGGFPGITNDISGGYSSPTNNALQFWVNSFTSSTQQLVVNVAFNYFQGVSNLSAIILDIDRSSNTGTESGSGTYGYVDQIRNINATYNGTNVAGLNITTNGSPTYSVAGTGTNATITGNAVNDNAASGGNVTIDFSTNMLNSFAFTYGDATNAFSDPEQQAVSIYNISFTSRRTPEFKPGIAAILVRGLTVLFRRRMVS